MNANESLIQLMNTHTDIAIATVLKDVPNVRIVNFAYDSKRHCLYFTSFPTNQKVRELSENPTVSFTTIPKTGNAHVRGMGKAVLSEVPLEHIVPLFLDKMPDLSDIFDHFLETLLLYEIPFENVQVILDYEHALEWSRASSALKTPIDSSHI